MIARNVEAVFVVLVFVMFVARLAYIVNRPPPNPWAHTAARAVAWALLTSSNYAQFEARLKSFPDVQFVLHSQGELAGVNETPGAVYTAIWLGDNGTLSPKVVITGWRG